MLGYLILVIAIYLWITRRIKKFEIKKGQINIPREIVINLFFVYLLGVYILVFAPFSFKLPHFDTSTWNLTPFVEIIYQFKRKVNGIPVYGLLYLVGNIMLFVPFGFFVPMLFKKFARLMRVAFVGLIFSLSIEWLQATFTSRYFDIDDVIFNTVGAAVGYILFLLIWWVCSKLSVTNRFMIKIRTKV